MKWWHVVILVATLVLIGGLVYEKVDDSRTISALNELADGLRADKAAVDRQLELLRDELDASSSTVERLETTNRDLESALAASSEQNAVLEALLRESDTVTGAIGGGLEEAIRLIQLVMERIRVDQEAIGRTVH